MNKSILFTLGLVAMFFVASNQGTAAQEAEDYDPEARLAELGITLPIPPSPVANYVNGVRTGNLIFLATAQLNYEDARERRGL